MGLEDYRECQTHCSKVIAKDPTHVKCLFRRGCARHKLGYLDEARFDLDKAIELDAGNIAAKRELVTVIKAIKERKAKDKAAFSNMFSGKSMYDDREQEMQEKEMDEYNRSKIDRRNEGKDEQTFEEWKKENEDIKKAEEEDRKKKEEKERKDREERERKEREERKKVRADAVDDDLYKPNRSK